MAFETRAVCVGCWNARNPARPAPAHVTDDCGNVEPEPCGHCGKTTTSGIFVKIPVPAEKEPPCEKTEG